MLDRKLEVDLNELVEAMDSNFDGTIHFFLDTRTGAVHPVSEEWLDDEDDEDDGDDEAVEQRELPQWQQDERALAADISADGERFIAIPHTESHEAYRVMEDFIPRVADPRLREKLAHVIDGKHPFRRFKDALFEHPGVRDDWFRFETEVKRQWAADWLESIGIESTWKPPAEAAKD